MALSSFSQFRGYLPVVVDIETGGLNPNEHAVLQLAAGFIQEECLHYYRPGTIYSWQVIPHETMKVDPKTTKIHGISPNDKSRQAVSEEDALKDFTSLIKAQLATHKLNRAIMIAHNANFDLNFLKAMLSRNQMPNCFHDFVVIDTSALALLAGKHNVLAIACAKMGIPFDSKQAHDAIYDVMKTADLFCSVFNLFNQGIELLLEQE